MKDVALKICGLTDAMIAQKAVKLGVDYIGLVFHTPSKRHLDLQKAIDISEAVHQAGGLIVPVFVNQTADEILTIGEKINADLMQLHGKPAVAVYTEVSQHYPCILAASYLSPGVSYSKERCFLLYDAPTPGSGQQADWDALTVDSSFRFFIAGGINRHNVIAACDYFHPFGLDISTGVESSPGVKDLGLIEDVVVVLANAGV